MRSRGRRPAHHPRLGAAVLLGALLVPLLPRIAGAAANLTIDPITWNVVGLDSNRPTTDGPSQFATGARVCNTGSDPATNVVSDYVWDSSNSFIDLTGSSSLSVDALAAGSCTDFYFNVVITRDLAAFDTTRRYHVTATADGLGTVSTPTPREIYVEHLVSQARNSIDDITGPLGPGDPPATTVYVGQTYTYKLYSSTAPAGYEQMSSYLDFPNVIFQIQSVSSTYTAPPGGTNDTIYADACGWQNDPTLANYKDCVGPDQYSGGKAGGTMVTTFVVKVLSAGTTTINSLVYDFSGSSFHYNSDYGLPATSIDVTAVEPPSDVSVLKTDSPDPVTAGTDETYTLTVANAGPGDAENVVVSDPLPAGTSFVSADNGGTESGGTVTWNLGTLTSGQSVDLQLVVHVDESRGADLSNTAMVTTDSTDSDSSNDSATETTTVDTSADLSVAKSDAPDAVLAGEDLAYTIDVTNAGPSDAANVVVSDPLPAGTSFVSADNGGSEAGGTVTWNLGDLAPGTASLTLVVHVDPDHVGALSNTASATSDTSDPDPSNDSATEGTGVDVSADLSVSKSDGSSSVNEGGSAIYTITVSNGGPSTEPAGVVVSDVIPAGVSASESEADCVISGGAFTCTTTSAIDPGDSLSYDLTLDVPFGFGPAQLTNTAQIDSAPVADPDSSGNTDTDTDDVDPAVDLSLAKDDGVGSVTAGGSTTYTITLANESAVVEPAGVVVTDAIPSGVTATESEADCQISGGTFTCTTSSSLAAGDFVSYRLTFDVDSGYPSSTLDNTAQIASAPRLDPEGDNGQATDTDAVDSSADLSVSKSDSSDPVVAGTDLTYTIDVTNSGPSDAANVVVTDPLPAGVSFVSADNGGLLIGGSAVWTLGTLPPGTTTLTLNVTADTPGVVTNTATVESITADPEGSNNSDSEDTSVAALSSTADLSITKADSPDPVVVGQDLTYTIDVTNDGPADAQDVVVTDALPAGVTFGSTDNGGTEAGGVVTWDLGTVAAGGSVTVHVFVTPGSAGSISNSATVTSSTVDPDLVNNTSAEDTDVSSVADSADVSIDKSDSPDPVVAGKRLTYSITVSNAGPATARNVTVSDALPAGVTFVSVDGSGAVDGVDVVWSVGRLTPGQSVGLTLEVRVDGAQTDPISNTATVSSSTADADLANNSDTEETKVRESGGSGHGGGDPVDLSVKKTVDDRAPKEGDELTYTVRVTNDGRDDATGIVVKDALPDGLKFVAASANHGTYDNRTGKWNIGKLAKGRSAKLTIKARVQNGTAGDEIVNEAKGAAVDQRDTSSGNDSSTASTGVEGAGGSSGDDGGEPTDTTEPANTTHAGSLAFTGAGLARVLIAFASLLLAGVVALAAARRRREDPDPAG